MFPLSFRAEGRSRGIHLPIVIPSGGPKARSRGIAIFPIEGSHVATRTLPAFGARSIHDEQRRARLRARSMWLGVIGNLIAHSRCEPKPSAVGELGLEIAGQTKQHMTFPAPMVRAVARRIFDHSNANRTEMARPPSRRSRFTGVLGRFDRGPVRGTKGDLAQDHGPGFWGSGVRGQGYENRLECWCGLA